MHATLRPAVRRTRYRWVVLGLAFLVYTIAFADRAVVGIALPHIKQDFALDNVEAGLLAGLFSMSYAVGQFPAGLVVRKLGARRVIPWFVALTSVVSATGGIAAGVTGLILSRVALGVVEAPIGLALMATINAWFPRTEKGIAAGVFSAATKFGPVIVPPLGALIIVSFGWRPVFFAFAIPGLLAALAWYLLVAESPERSRFVNEGEAQLIAEDTAAAAQGANTRQARPLPLDRFIRVRAFTPIDSTAGLFRSWTIIGVALCYMLVQSVVSVVLFLLPLYLTEEKHLSVMNVGWVAATPFVGAVIGNILGGLASDRLFGGRRKPMMLVTFAATAVSMWVLSFAPDSIGLLAALLFLTGVLLAVGYSPYTIYAAPMTTRAAFPVAVSLINTMGQVGTALAPVITGLLLDRYGWSVVFVVLSLGSLLGLAILTSVAEPVTRQSAA